MTTRIKLFAHGDSPSENILLNCGYCMQKGRKAGFTLKDKHIQFSRTLAELLAGVYELK